MDLFEHTMRAMDRIIGPAPTPPQPQYRGAQADRAYDGDEWLRMRELIDAGQTDLFADTESVK